MSGHGSPRPEDKANHPNRDVSNPPKFTGQGWPATTQEWDERGGRFSPVRGDDVSLGQHGDYHYIQHRPGDDPAAGKSNKRFEGD